MVTPLQSYLMPEVYYGTKYLLYTYILHILHNSPVTRVFRQLNVVLILFPLADLFADEYAKHRQN